MVKSFDANLSTVDIGKLVALSSSVPKNLFDVLGSDGSSTSILKVITDAPLAHTVLSASPDEDDDESKKSDDGGEKTGGDGERKFIVTPAPQDLNKLLLFRFNGAPGANTYQLSVTYKLDQVKTFVPNPKLSRGKDFFLYVLNGSVPSKSIPLLSKRVVVEAPPPERRTKDKFTLKLTFKKGDFFGIIDDGNDHYRLYTPLTGQYFAFRLKDQGTFRYKRLNNTVVHSDMAPFGFLVNPVVSTQISRLTLRGPAMRSQAIKTFVGVQNKITRDIHGELRTVSLRKERFIFRIGDVVTGFNDTKSNWLAVRVIYNKFTNKNYILFVQDDGTNFQNTDLAHIEPLTIIQEAPPGMNPIGNLSGVQYVTTLLHKPMDGDKYASAEAFRQSKAFKEIYSALQPKVEQIMRTMGLVAEEADMPAVPRDLQKELPPDTSNSLQQANQSDPKPGNIVYLTGLPDQESKVNGPVDPEKLRKDMEDEIKAINPGLTDEDKVKERERIVQKYNAIRAAGTMQVSKPITFPGSEGWYLIVERKDREDSSEIEWTLMPYPQTRKIKAKLPITVDLKKPSSPLSTFTTGMKKAEVHTKDVAYDYFVFRMPSAGKGSLLDFVTSSAGTEDRIKTVQWPKDPKAIQTAIEYVKQRDISGNVKRINVGELINYKGQLNYVVGKTKQGEGFKYTMAPLKAFVDLDKSSLTMPFRFVDGGVKAIGYREITKPADGPDSLDQQARKVATADQLDGSGLKELFLTFYANFEADGRPRAMPMQLSQIHLLKNTDRTSVNNVGVDKEFFHTTPPANKNGSESKPVDNQLQKLQRDRSVVTRIKQAVDNGQVVPGSLIQVDWGNNRITTEIFYGLVGDDKMRLVPHADLQGKPDGVVPATQYFDVLRTGNIVEPGFWTNYYNGFYESSASPKIFTFSKSFEDNFKKILKLAGEPVPEMSRNDDYPAQDNPDEVKRRFDTRRNLAPTDADNFVRRLERGELNTSNPGVEDAIGKVVQHMRDGQVIRSVVMTGVLNDFDAMKNHYFKVYPDSKVRMATSVNVIDVDRIVKPEEVDEFYNENAALHRQMHDAFSKYIRATRHPSFDTLDPVLADYYKQYFGITLI